MVKGFTLIELLIVLTIYSLVLLLVFPLLKNKAENEDILRNIITSYMLRAVKEKKTYTLKAIGNRLIVNARDSYTLPEGAVGECVIRASGIPFYCYFKIGDLLYVFTELGYKRIPITSQ